ncbi:hypothetical protein M0805_001847 [Coniferiporia weirii]|nr:hypothetical protein M0805_001847 [Coniferiporia weirii]
MASTVGAKLARVGRMSLTFLGTSGVGGPSQTRSGAALSLNFNAHDGADPMRSWLLVVDCGEGTRRQLTRSSYPRIRNSNVRKVFLSQLDVDHCAGIIPLMTSVMSTRAAGSDQEHKLLLEFYGPMGLRRFVRDSLRINNVRLRGLYRVHELATANMYSRSQMMEGITRGAFGYSAREEGIEEHPNELLGEDLICRSNQRQLWMNIVPESPHIRVDAGSSTASGKTLGFVFTERSAPTGYPPRKVAVLSSKIYPTAMQKIAMDATVMVHGVRYAWIAFDPVNPGRRLRTLATGPFDHLSEDATVVTGVSPSEQPSQSSMGAESYATNLNDLQDMQALEFFARTMGSSESLARLEDSDMKGPKPDSAANLRAYAARQGYATPDMVGEFARSVRARQLVLNQFDPRFADPHKARRLPATSWKDSLWLRVHVMTDIERQATKAFGGYWETAATDLLVVPVRPEYPPAPAETPVDTEEQV